MGFSRFFSSKLLIYEIFLEAKTTFFQGGLLVWVFDGGLNQKNLAFFACTFLAKPAVLHGPSCIANHAMGIS